MSRNTIGRKAPITAAAAATLSPLDIFLNELKRETNKENRGDIDFIELSKAIINFDVNLVARGNPAQQTAMQAAVMIVISKLHHSSPENTYLAIDNLCKISALYNITLNSAQILDFAAKRLESASQPEVSNILHSLVQCGLNEEHCAKYSKRILDRFVASSKHLLTMAGRYKSRETQQGLYDVICSLSHLKNLGILSNDPQLVEILQKIPVIIAQPNTPLLKTTTLNSLLEVRLYCQEVLKIGLDRMKCRAANFENPTISPIQKKIFDLVINLLAKKRGGNHLIEKIDHHKRIRSRIGENCTIELEGLYGRTDGRLIRSADIIITIGNERLVIEVDGITHFANIDGKKCARGQTVARNQIIRAVTEHDPIIIETQQGLDSLKRANEVLTRNIVLTLMRQKISSEAVAQPAQEEVELSAALDHLEDLAANENGSSHDTAGEAAASDLDATKTVTATDTAISIETAPAPAAAAAAATITTKSKKAALKAAASIKSLSAEEHSLLAEIQSVLFQVPINFTTLKEVLDGLLEKNFNLNLLYDQSAIINKDQKDFAYTTTAIEYIADSFDPRLMLIFLEYDQKFVTKNSATSAAEIKSLPQRFDDLIAKNKKGGQKQYSTLSRILKILRSEPLSSEEVPQPKSTKQLAKWKKDLKAVAPKEKDEQEKEELRNYITNFDSANHSKLLTAAIIANEPWKVRFLLINKGLVNQPLTKKDLLALAKEMPAGKDLLDDESPYYPIHIAVMENKVDMMRLLLDFGANPYQQGPYNSNLYHLAAANGSLAVMEDLPEEFIQEFSSQKTGYNNKTVANVAANSGYLNILEFLHNHKVAFDVNDVKFALLQNNLPILEFLYSVNPDLFIETEKEIASACHRAASNSNLDLLKFLCETLKANTAMLHKGNTLLHSATNGDENTLAYVFSLPTSIIEAKNKKGETALYYAVINDRIAATAFLIDKGADIIAAIPFVEGAKESESEASDENSAENSGENSAENSSEEETDLSDEDSLKDPESDEHTQEASGLDKPEASFGAPPLPPQTLSLHADEGFDQYEATSISHAAGNGQLEMLKMLLSHKAAREHINIKTHLGNTILHEAARNNYRDVVKYLVLEMNMPIDTRNSRGLTPLMSAIEVAQNETTDAADFNCDAWDIIAFLSQEAPDRIADFDKSAYINAKSHSSSEEHSHQQTALGLAIRYHISHGEPANSLVKILLTNQAQVDIKNDYGRTILLDTISLGNIPEIDFMKIAKPLLAFSKKDYDQPDKDGNTLLHLAVLQNYPTLVALLIRLGAKTNAQNKNGIIPIVFTKNRTMYDLLNTCKPEYPLEQDKLLRSMNAAIKFDNVDVFESLLQKMKVITSSSGAAQSNNNYLHYAAQHNAPQIIKLLRQDGQNINHISENMTPLQCAVIHRSIASVKALLKPIAGTKAANVNLHTEKNPSPLYMAAENNDTKMFKLLLTYHAEATKEILKMIAQCIVARNNNPKAPKKDTIWQCLVDNQMVQSKTPEQYIEVMSLEARPPSRASVGVEERSLGTSPSSASASADEISLGTGSPSSASARTGGASSGTSSPSSVSSGTDVVEKLSKGEAQKTA